MGLGDGYLTALGFLTRLGPARSDPDMTADLGLPTRIEARPIVREPDGLALSSRNVYLTEAERAQAVHINKGLAQAETLAREGERDAAVVLAAVQEYFAVHMGKPIR